MERSRIYGVPYRQQLAPGVAASARIIVPLLTDAFGPRRVVDIGCGDGRWLAEMWRTGVSDILGLDGFVPPGSMCIPADRLRRVDLEQVAASWVPPDHADVALCLEVAEHLKPERCDEFIDGLCACAPVIAFSAAVPGQGGDHHVNEQWQSFWARRFVDHGFEPLDMIRGHVWEDRRVDYWYAQNMLVYARPSAITERAREMTRPLPLDLVHPRQLEAVLLRERSGYVAAKNFLCAVKRNLRPEAHSTDHRRVD